MSNEKFIKKMFNNPYTPQKGAFRNLVWEYSNVKGIHVGLVVPMDYLIRQFKNR